MYIQLKNIAFRYPNSNEDVIKNFFIEIEKGEIVAILGESGSGKSTLLRIIAGFELPYQGSIKIGEQIALDDKNFLLTEKRNVGMVFQDYALFPHFTVAKNIQFGISEMSKAEKNKKLDEILELINLKGFENRYPHELSGGQQQRVALGRSLAPSPSLLLLDEPFSNLDAHLKHKIRSELKEIMKNSGVTALFVSHDKEDPLSIADKVVVLENGHITQNGKPHEVLDHPSSLYLSHIFENR